MRQVPICDRLSVYYDRFDELLNKGISASVILPTGCGKSHFVLRYIQTHPPRNLLFLTSRIAIIKDFEEKLARYEILIPNFQAYIYSSLSYRMNNKQIGTEYNMIVMDEYRHSGATLAESNLRSIINLNPDALLLGMDATPVRYLDINGPRDMTDPFFENHVAVELDLYQAVADGILIAPDYISCIYDFSKSCPEFLLIPENIQYKTSFYKQMYEKARRSLKYAKGLETLFYDHIRYPNGKYIVFCSNIPHMKNMMTKARTEWFIKWKRPPSIYWDYSDCPPHKENYDAFKNNADNHLMLLFCIDMLSEGVHPEVDGVILLRPTSSPNVFYQQIGRCMSITKHRTPPQIIDIVRNLDNLAGILSCPVNKIINESEAVDIYSIHPETAKNHYTAPDDDVPVCAEAVDLCKPFTFRVQYFYLDMADVLLNIKNSLPRSLFSWNIGLNVARYYYNTYGNLDILPDEMYLGFPLGDWIAKARCRRWSNGPNHLNETQIRDLDDLHIDWHYEPGWKVMYKLAEQFYLKHHHLTPEKKIPAKYKALPGWLTRQRAKAKGTIVPPLSDKQKKMLDNIGMIWDLRHRSDIWYERYNEIKSLVSQYPALDFPASGKTQKAYTWLRQQIDYLTGKRPSPLNSKQRKLLMELNIIDRKQPHFWIKIEHIKRFIKKYGKLPRYNGTKDGEKELYQWIRNQTRKKTLAKMNKKKKHALSELGIIKQD